MGENISIIFRSRLTPEINKYPRNLTGSGYGKMGKVRRYRQKYHLSKFGSSKSTANDVKDSSVNETKPNSIGENIFAGLDIPFDSLTKTLGPDFDARSVASTKSRKELKLEEQHLKKRVKRKLRHDRFLQKLDVTKQAMRADKKKGMRKKGPSDKNGNQTPDAILPWAPLFSSKFKSVEAKQKPKGIMKMKKRLKQQTKDAKQMRKILKDKKFRLNPGETIIDFLKKKVASAV